MSEVRTRPLQICLSQTGIAIFSSLNCFISFHRNVSVKSRCAQITADLTQVALDPELTLEPDEAAHIIDTLAKLQRYMHNLKTHREMSQSMSKNSKMDGDGVIGMSNLVAVPMRGAARDTALTRKRGWHEKMVDERKRKASKGEQISIKKYLS